MKFEYRPTGDFGKPLTQRLGSYPRMPDLTWDFLRWLGSWLGVLIIRTQFPLKVEGNAPDPGLPENRRVAIVANHQSHLDTAAILTALPYRARRNIAVLAAADYFFTKTGKAVMASLLSQAVAFDRMHWTGIRAWYTHLKDLERGWILFYPSGSRHSAELQEGLIKILLKAGWAILPARVEGTADAWPPGKAVWRPFRRLRVTFFEPYRGADMGELMEKLRREITS